MRKEIEQTLLRLGIEAKETRKEKIRNILIIVVLEVVFFLIPYFIPQVNILFALEALILVFGNFYIGFDAIPALLRPLDKPEVRAFQKIAKAIQTLEKSNEPIAYEEAYRCLKSAHKTLKVVRLRKDVEWYNEVNQTLEKFFKNLESIVLPTTSDSSIKTEHLEEIVLAILSMNPSKVDEVNKILESDKTYKKTEPQPSKIRVFARRFRESIFGKVLGSLTLGYIIVLSVCVI